jgi:glycosyltransferase involved in cell wall biosynthesis
MKITFVLPCADLTGGVRVVTTYADRLTKMGHDVLVVSLPQSDLSLREKFIGLLKGSGWVTIPARSTSHLDRVDVNHQVLPESRPVTDADLPDADVIIATWWETAEWVAALSPSKGAKAYFIQHYEVFDYVPQDRVEATWKLPMHKIVVAQWLEDIARNRFHDPTSEVVANGVDSDLFFAPPRSKQSTPTVGMIYNSPAWKGCDISLKAYKLAAEKIPNLRLVVFGNHGLVDHLPLPAGVEYISAPPPDKIRALYSQCDAWLFGSRSEGFGLPILEAMACRTPVIGTPAGAAFELLSDGNGVLVKPEDPEDMARAIVQVCQMPDEEWRELSDRAHAEAMRHTWEKATLEFEAALNTAISRSQNKS